MRGAENKQILGLCFSRFQANAFLKKDCIYLFLESGEGKGEREGEKHQRVVASCVPHTGELACNPGMCPKGESSLGPFAS